jgi:hypothetical protein
LAGAALAASVAAEPAVTETAELGWLAAGESPDVPALLAAEVSVLGVCSLCGAGAAALSGSDAAAGSDVAGALAAASLAAGALVAGALAAGCGAGSAAGVG